MAHPKIRPLLTIAAGAASALVACSNSSNNRVIGFVEVPSPDAGEDAGQQVSGVFLTPPDAGPDAPTGCPNQVCGTIAIPPDGGSDASDGVGDASDGGGDASAPPADAHDDAQD